MRTVPNPRSRQSVSWRDFQTIGFRLGIVFPSDFKCRVKTAAWQLKAHDAPVKDRTNRGWPRRPPCAPPCAFENPTRACARGWILFCIWTAQGVTIRLMAQVRLQYSHGFDVLDTPNNPSGCSNTPTRRSYKSGRVLGTLISSIPPMPQQKY